MHRQPERLFGGFMAPVHMVWLATNACTARCRHCSSDSARRAADELTTSEACDLLEQFADCGVVDLAISGGEPLLRRDLPAIIGHAKSLDMTVGLGSNGAHFSAKVATALRDAGLDRIQFSLDGMQAEHDYLRCWPGLFAKVLRAIDIAATHDLRVHVCCTINRINAASLERFAEQVAELPVRKLNFSRFVPTGRGTRELDLDDASWPQITARVDRLRHRLEGRLAIVTHHAQEALLDESLLNMPAFQGCQAGAAQGCVTANGTVLPCVLLPIPLGNVRAQPFETIWGHAPLARELRARDRLRGRCGVCPVAAKCGGCRAVAWARTGDVWSEDPRCSMPAAVSAAMTTTQGAET